MSIFVFVCIRMRQYWLIKHLNIIIITTRFPAYAYTHTHIVQIAQIAQMSKHKYDINYLTEDNGCIVIEQSSQRERGPASSILSSDHKSVWVTVDPLPQYCVISLKQIIKKPYTSTYNTIGFYAWHQYDSNPSLIEVWVKTTDRDKDRDKDRDRWQLLSKIRLNKIDIWQYFKIQQLNADKLKDIKIVIVQNFGDTKTYLNKIGLFYSNQIGSRQNVRQQSIAVADGQDIQTNLQNTNTMANISATPSVVTKYLSAQNTNSNSNKNPPLRQKTHSQFQKIDKLQQTQKQLRRAHDRINRLTDQQQTMKKTILQQQKIIIKIQQTLKSVLLNMDKMHKIQKFNVLNKQVDQIMPSQGKKLANLMKDQELQYDQYQEKPTKHKKTSKNTSKNKQIQQLRRNLRNFQRQELQYNSKAKQKLNSKQKDKNDKNSEYKKNDKKQNRSNNKYSQTPIHYGDVIRANSEDDLSQYSHPNNLNNYGYNYRTSQAGDRTNSAMGSASKGEKVMMYQRLLKLLQLKEKKKLQLKKSAAKTGSKSRAKRMSLYEQANDGSNSDDEIDHETYY